MYESDEIQYTLSEEITFINSHNESKEAMLILAFVDGVPLRENSEAEE